MNKLNHLPALANIVGSHHLLTDPQDMARYATDWRGRYYGRPLAVALPSCQEEVLALVLYCNQHHIAMVPQGGNTSTCGGATPDSTGRMLILAMQRMNRILSVDPVADTIYVEAGVTLAAAQQAARAHHRLLPLALASEGSCQIGGNISTNAGGTAALRYGTMRHLVLSIEAVLPNGSCLNEKNALRKDTTGLDIKQLLIGAEGTLGIITAATLKLFPQPRSYATSWVGMPTIEAAVNFFVKLKEAFGETISACEIMARSTLDLVKTYRLHQSLPIDTNWVLLIELTHHAILPLSEELAAWLAAQDIAESIVAQSMRERELLWQWREDIPEAERQARNIIKHDIALPIETIPSFISSCQSALQKTFPRLSLVVFGHLGDGSLHFNVTDTTDLTHHETAINTIVYEQVKTHQGTIAAEHGIGQLKKRWLALYKNPAALAWMRAIKQHMDPKNLMNPHSIYSLPVDTICLKNKKSVDKPGSVVDSHSSRSTVTR